jgi:hypothetical protein
MAFSSATALSLPAEDPRAEIRAGAVTLGLALSARWLIAVLLLTGGVFVGNRAPLSEQDWLVLVQGRAFVDVVLAAVTAAGAFALTRAPDGRTARGGLGLRLLALADLGLVFSWSLEAPLLPPYAAARLVAMTALIHACFAYAALRHLGELCAAVGELGAGAWARAAGWAFLVAAVLALGSAPPLAWIALGLTVPVTNPALPVVVVVAIGVTLRLRRALS